MARRLSWGIADQAVCSLTNFLLSVFVARSLGAAQFGAFSLAYVTYGFAINASRGLSIEPLLVRFSTANLATWRRATAGSTGTALLVGLATGTIALAAGLLIGGTTGLAFVALGLMLPGLLLQDSWRYAFFALGRGHHALINDTVLGGGPDSSARLPKDERPRERFLVHPRMGHWGVRRGRPRRRAGAGDA